MIARVANTPILLDGIVRVSGRNVAAVVLAAIFARLFSCTDPHFDDMHYVTFSNVTVGAVVWNPET